MSRLTGKEISEFRKDMSSKLDITGLSVSAVASVVDAAKLSLPITTTLGIFMLVEQLAYLNDRLDSLSEVSRDGTAVFRNWR
jgi:hypothetical protein